MVNSIRVWLEISYEKTSNIKKNYKHYIALKYIRKYLMSFDKGVF